MIKLLALVAFAFVAISFSTNKATASTKVHYIDSYPKSMQGIWYEVTKTKNGEYFEAVAFKKNKSLQAFSDGTQYGTVLYNVNAKHVKVNKKAKFTPKYVGYYIGKGGKKFYFSKTWNTKRSAKPNFICSRSTFKGHAILVLYDRKYNTVTGYFRTQKLAEEFVNKE